MINLKRTYIKIIARITFFIYFQIKRIENTLAILRWGSMGSLLVISNLGRQNSEVQLSRIPGLPNEMTVAVSSGGLNNFIKLMDLFYLIYLL